VTFFGTDFQLAWMRFGNTMGSKQELCRYWRYWTAEVSSPDSNIIEALFHSVKTHLYARLRDAHKMMNVEDLRNWYRAALEDWWNYYDGDNKLLRHSYKFLEDLIECQGNLQTIALKKIGLKSTQEVKMTLLPVDQ